MIGWLEEHEDFSKMEVDLQGKEVPALHP